MSVYAAEKDAIRHDRSELERCLTDNGARIRGSSASCLFHDDKHPSGSIYQGEDGAWRFKCHTAACAFCGDIFDIMAKLSGRTVGDVLKETVNGPRMRQDAPKSLRTVKKVFSSIEELERSIDGVERVYAYANPDAPKVDMVVIRYRKDGKKEFLQARPELGGYVLRAPEKPWPLYNRVKLKDADWVVVAEGERCVHEFAGCGIVATTSPGGAGKAACADWSPLAGKKVYLWPDSDPPDPKTGKRSGTEHMRDVAAELFKLTPAPTVFMVDVDAFKLPPKGDIVEYLDLYAPGAVPEDRQKIVYAALQTAALLGVSGELHQVIEETISGKRRAIEWPWPTLSKLSRALLPGTVTCICGDPGCGKSFLLLEAMLFWHQQGEKVALFELEEDRAFHLQRLFAQLANHSDLTDPGWVHTHPDETRRLFEANRDVIESFGRRMFEAPDTPPTHDSLLDWMKKQCEAGTRIIGIDPITAVEATDKPWIPDMKFMMAAKLLVRKSGASLILVTHPRKGKRIGKSLDDLAGGASFGRFSQTALWIERLDHVKREKIITGMNCHVEVGINRTIQLRKVRNGRGAGLDLGFYFDPRTLRFAELGLIDNSKDPNDKAD